MRCALYATLASNLGLSSRELAEIGGFSNRFARDLIAIRRPFPKDVCEALNDLEDDIDVLTDEIRSEVMEGQGVIWMYRDNADLRSSRPDIPSRGSASGGFIGPYRIAVMTAWDLLRAEGIEVDILLADTSA